MINKVVKIIIGLLMLSTLAYSQVFRHPYSNMGIGIAEESNFIQYLSMGGFSLSYKDSLTFTAANPASYSNIITEHNYYTTFDIAFKGRYFNLKQDTSVHNGNLLSFAYFSFGIPVIKKYGWAASIGLLPVSRIGYTNTYNDISMPDSIRIFENIQNSGGFSKFYIGSSLRPFSFLSLGFNAYYLFGNNKINHNLLFKDRVDMMGVAVVSNRYYGNFGFDFGTQMSFKLNSKLHLGIAATYSLPIVLKINQESLAVSFLNEASSIRYKDTVLHQTDLLGNMTIPQKFGAALSLTNPGRWIAGLEYNFQQWSSFNSQDSGIFMNDLHEFSLGAELRPKHDHSSPYLKRMAYRVGIKYAICPQKVIFDLEENPMRYYDLDKMAISFGTALPVRRSLSVINTGVEIGKIGKAEADIIRDFYVNFYLGFRLNDIWFKQSKIN